MAHTAIPRIINPTMPHSMPEKGGNDDKFKNTILINPAAIPDNICQ